MSSRDPQLTNFWSFRFSDIGFVKLCPTRSSSRNSATQFCTSSNFSGKLPRLALGLSNHKMKTLRSHLRNNTTMGNKTTPSLSQTQTRLFIQTRTTLLRRVLLATSPSRSRRRIERLNRTLTRLRLQMRFFISFSRSITAASRLRQEEVKKSSWEMSRYSHPKNAMEPSKTKKFFITSNHRYRYRANKWTKTLSQTRWYNTFKKQTKTKRKNIGICAARKWRSSRERGTTLWRLTLRKLSRKRRNLLRKSARFKLRRSSANRQTLKF